MGGGIFRACSYPGCGELIPLSSETRCPKHATQRKQECQRFRDKDRPTAARRGYDSRWRRIRESFLRAHPLCSDPHRLHSRRGGETIAATHVHHIDDNPKNNHRDNLEPLCHECHEIIHGRKALRV